MHNRRHGAATIGVRGSRSLTDSSPCQGHPASAAKKKHRSLRLREVLSIIEPTLAQRNRRSFRLLRPSDTALGQVELASLARHLGVTLANPLCGLNAGSIQSP